jgi:predicted alpha/beta hydrolase family esterase
MMSHGFQTRWSNSGSAATDVDSKLPRTPEDEAWLEDVLANIAMAQNDHLQSLGNIEQ